MYISLSVEKFQNAKRYLMNYGRDLEQELFRYYFEGGDAQPVIDLLEKYQGDNGGFCNMGEGHAVIPNGMDTCMAFQYLSEVGASANNEIVQQGITYIIDSYDWELKCWHGRPHQKSTGWRDNPCSELLGYLYEYRELVPDDFLHIVTEHATSSFSTIHTTEESRQFYFLEALCLLRLANRIDEPFKSSILQQLYRDIEEIIETDSTKWSTIYCAKPYFFAPSPDSLMCVPIKNHVLRSLENEIKTQSEDGHFILNWNCEDDGAKVWKSIWTMDVLKTLHHHGMIERAAI
ncbi:hypothetical protein MHZ92_15215 [Sporosarcina sp. ACRSL]|uniref:hypothetical protein n=1 Tax=Sporosarcina sp. ACRSL TaxID=2918215 RepID=UPI001EF50E07|nr:hypothetical protein [Sporosarcina sp. ACRSL]MCG7345486.1 hypothetical protein [Sporosarcina sp. ACRSL]